MSENSKGLVSRMYFKILYINKKNTSTSVEKKLKDYYEEAICQRRISTAIKHMKRYSSLFVIREKQVKTRALSAHLFIWQKLGSWSMPNICGGKSRSCSSGTKVNGGSHSGVVSVTPEIYINTHTQVHKGWVEDCSLQQYFRRPRWRLPLRKGEKTLNGY